MRRIILLLLPVSMLLCFSSCKKHSDNKVTNVSLDISLASGQVYNLDLSQYGDADDLATIVTQATAYDISQIAKTSGRYVYSFQKTVNTKTGVNDNETVVLKVYEPAGRCKTEETNITIHFTIQ